MTLYDLTQDYQDLLLLAEDPGIDQEVLKDTMESIQGELEVKADSYVCVIKELDAEADKLKKEIDRLTVRMKKCTESVKHMKESLMESMKSIDKKKLATEHFNLSIVKNGGVQPMKIDGDVPQEFCRLEPDNDKIRRALLLGEQLDFARLEERGTHLTIK